MALEVGQKAPSFELKINEGNFFKSSDFKGKYLVLYFYPKDNTPGCTTEANNFNDLLDRFKEQDAIVVGVSKDSLKSHEKFKQKYGLNFNLAADEELEICNLFGTYVEKSMYGKKYMGINRSTFLVGPEGEILNIWPKVSVKNHADEVLQSIKNHRAL